jgi:hypothetical protein
MHLPRQPEFTEQSIKQELAPIIAMVNNPDFIKGVFGSSFDLNKEVIKQCPNYTGYNAEQCKLFFLRIESSIPKESFGLDIRISKALRIFEILQLFERGGLEEINSWISKRLEDLGKISTEIGEQDKLELAIKELNEILNAIIFTIPHIVNGITVRFSDRVYENSDQISLGYRGVNRDTFMRWRDLMTNNPQYISSHFDLSLPYSFFDSASHGSGARDAFSSSNINIQFQLLRNVQRTESLPMFGVRMQSGGVMSSNTYFTLPEIVVLELKWLDQYSPTIKASKDELVEASDPTLEYLVFRDFTYLTTSKKEQLSSIDVVGKEANSEFLFPSYKSALWTETDEGNRGKKVNGFFVEKRDKTYILYEISDLYFSDKNDDAQIQVIKLIKENNTDIQSHVKVYSDAREINTKLVAIPVAERKF